MNKPIDIVLVDDHSLVRRGLAELITKLDYNVLYECANGNELMIKIEKNDLPDIILMDINMPGMDGIDSTLWLKENYPLIKVIALSMHDDERSIIRMIRNGARGYILKDIESGELKRAIDSVLEKGVYNSELVSSRLMHSIQTADRDASSLSEKETTFLKLAATELTYKEIAGKMHLSPRTIDGYRDELFEKLNVKSRVGLVLFAIKNRIVIA